MADKTSWNIGIGDRLLRVALWILPETFRATFADEILSYHRSRMHDVSGSPLARFLVWSGAIWDVFFNGLRERGALFGERLSLTFRPTRHAGKGPNAPRSPKNLGPYQRFRQYVVLDPFAFRRLRKSPRFTVVTVLTLGLGIGANTALFSVVYSVLLNPLPYENSGDLVFAWETRENDGRTTSVSPGNFDAWRGESTGLQSLASARYRAFNVTGGERPFRVNGLEVSADMLSLLGANPTVGREFTRADELPGVEPVCMVSHSFWQDRLGSEHDLSKLSLMLNGESHQVVGILPSGLTVPSFGPNPILAPLPQDPSDPSHWGNHNARVIGRLADGVDFNAANAELQTIAARLEETRNEDNDGIGAQLVPARDQLVQNARTTLWILFATVGFVLLIACVNVANLLLARAARAERELAVRAAIGATRAHIVRLVLSEALLLSLAGGLLGLGIGYAGVEAIQHWGPENLPRLSEITMSLPVFSYTFACAICTGLLFGIVPALRSARVDVQTTLNKGGRSPGMGSNQRIQRYFVVAEVAIAVVLLNCSGLLLRTFTNLLDVDPGFDMKGRIALQVSLPGAPYAEHSRVHSFLDQLHQNINAIPGVESSGSSVGLPFHWIVWRTYMTLEGKPAATIPEIPIVDVSISTPGYIETMDIELLAGRSILASDDTESPFIAVVNEAFVREYLPGEEPIGRRLRFAQPDALLPVDQTPEDVPWHAIVGVVEDVKRWNLTSDAAPEVYVPQRQYQWAREFFVVANTTLPFDDIADQMRQAVWDVDPEQPVAWVRPVEALHSAMVAQPRFNASLVGAFGITSLILALIGIYGLMANVVSARTQEIGVRVALGARPKQILNHIASQGMTAAGIGIAIGIAASAAATRVLSTMLFGVQPIDPITFLSVLVAVLLVAAFATSFPSWRAARMDAIEALSSDQ